MIKSSLQKWFAEEKFWSWAWIVFGAIAVMKGLRLPNRWGATESVIGYDFGFIKRGLTGATFGRWFGLQHYEHFVVFAYIEFVIFLALLVLLLRRSGVLQSSSGRMATCVLSACFGLTCLSNMVGYLDIGLAVLQLVVLTIGSPKMRAIVAWPVCIAAVLVHEQFVFSLLPLILFQLYIDQPPATRPKKRLRFILPLGLIALTLVAVVSLKSPFSEAQANQFQHYVQGKVDFPVREDSFWVLTRSGAQNVIGTVKDLLTITGFLKFVAGVFIILPAALFSFWMARSSVKQVPTGYLIAATFAPLLLSLVGWDFQRWDSIVCLEAFLTLCVLTRAGMVTEHPISDIQRNAAIFLIAIGMATGKPLMDRGDVDSFPQFHLARDIVNGLHSHHIEPSYK